MNTLKKSLASETMGEAAISELATDSDESNVIAMSATDVIVSGDSSGFAQEIAVGPHRLTADEPIEFGGKDTGPGPYDLLLAALGSCTSMTISLYARTKKWPLESVTVNLRHSKIHAADCRDCETKEGKVDQIQREIHLVGNLDPEQHKRLLEIADKCPVHRTLKSEIDIQTKAV